MAPHMVILVMIFLMSSIFSIIRSDAISTLPCGPCTCSEIKGTTLADCSDKGLIVVPQDLPTNTAELDLSNNNIGSFNTGLKRYGLLKKLNISYNSFHSLTSDDFTLLSDLTVLDLSYNKLRLDNTTYPEGLFRNQTMLSKLIIHHNSQVEGSGLDYPDETFSNLASLEYLTIDGLRDPMFGQGFLKLMNLKMLKLQGNCDIRTLRNDTFLYTPHISYLYLQYCVILYIEPSAFQPLMNIHELDLSENIHLGVPNFGIGLYGLRNSSIKILRANYINTHHGAGVQVRKEDVQYLRSTQLEEFSFDGNRIEILDSEVPIIFPNTIKRASVRDNMALFGMYLLSASAMTGLEWADLSWQHQSYTRPFTVNNIHGNETSPLNRNKRLVKPERDNPKEMPSPLHFNDFQFFVHKDIPWPGNFTVFVPPNISFANFSHSKITYTMPRIHFGPNQLKVLDLSYNFLTRWRGPVLGLEQLEYLDLSHNYCDYMTDEIALHFPSIKFVNMSSNYLGYSLTDKVLPQYDYLEVLDLSNNKISHLKHDFLDKIISLRQLHLSSNFLTSWEINIGNMENLTELDLSNNLFEQLPESLESQLAMIQNSKLKVHIHNNPLKCSCETLPSLIWIKTYGMNMIDFQNVSCVFLNTKQSLKNLPDLVTELEKSCASYFGVMIGVFGFLLLFLGVLTSGLVYRYRWKLRYLYYLTLNRHKGYMTVQDEEQNFEFDAFISYADEDRGFIVRDMRTILEDTGEEGERFQLCIHHRDFLPGEAIAANIQKAINTSRKTVVILTRNLLKSYWCRYEVEMAKMESIYRGRSTLLIVVMEDIPVKDLPADIVDVMRKDSYIEFTKDSEGQKIFWLNLKRALRN